MEKRIKTLILLIFFIILLSSVCNAQSDSSTISDFLENAPDDFKDIEAEDVSSIVGFDNIAGTLVSELLKGLQSSTGLLSAACCLSLITSIGGAIGASRSVNTVLSSVCCTALIGISFTSVNAQIELVSKAAKSAEVFASSAIPVISALSISSGESFSAIVFASAMSLCNTVFSFISDRVLLPLCILFLIIGLMSGLSENTSLSAANGFIKKAVKWFAGVFAGVFTASVSLQRFLSSASDSLVKRSVKSAVGAFIPVVGGTLAGSVDSVFTLASNSRTTLAVLGIAVIGSVFSPVIIQSACCAASMSVAKIFAGSAGAKQAERSVAAIADTFMLLSGVCSLSAFLFVISFLLVCIII